MNAGKIDRLLVEISYGSNVAFAALYEATRRGVFSFLHSYLKNRADTEEVLQDVYLKIKLNADKYTEGTNGRAWILQIAKNLALNRIKRGKRTEPLEEVEAVAESEFPLGIEEIMRRVLDDDERRIVILHVLWGYKHREIAQIMHCPTGTVTSKYKRSIAKLKSALKEEGQ